MIETTFRLLIALKIVDDAGSSLEPSWDPHLTNGFVYRGTSSALANASLLADFEELADRSYLERVFVDRLSLCPNCGGHALNVREICIECHASNIVAVETLLHFRCAFVGPASLFVEEAVGRRCPKCRRLLRELGTDHSRPGDYFSCKACNATFQVPDVGAVCLSCGGRFAGEEMKTIPVRDVYAYRITGLGRAALFEGRLLEKGSEALYERDGSVYRRHVLLDMIDDECRRRRTIGSVFGLIIVATKGEAIAPQVRALLIETDKLAHLDDRHLVAVLPGATKARTRATLLRIRRLPVSAAAVEGTDPADIIRRLDEAARNDESSH